MPSDSRLGRLVKSSRKLFRRKNRGEGQEEGAYQWAHDWTPPDIKWIDLDCIRQWIHTCDHEHGEECHPSSSQKAGRPLWLIDVEQDCLVPAAEHRYVALSYVWGGVESAQTTTDNIEAMQRPGALEEGRSGGDLVVPRTIRHAMGLARRLGERHLWVDRFCICQDDALTKHAQLGFMADIYGNAYLTIVAASEWDANHGLRGIEGLTKPRDLSPHLTKDQYMECMNIDDAIWSSRGWTFQENIFSRRKLLFQYQTVRWECRQSVWHESTGVSGRVPGHVTTGDWGWHRDESGNTNVHELKGLSKYELLRQYSHLVESYNTRDLAYPEDGLQAYLGVIQRFSEAVPGGFFWGLPVSDFHRALLWQPRETLVRRLSRRREAGLYELPSWSWVGWRGNVNMMKCLPAKGRPTLVPLCVWGVTNKSRTIGPLAVHAEPGDAHASLHEDPFLHAKAPVARAWLGGPTNESQFFELEEANFRSAFDDIQIGKDGVGRNGYLQSRELVGIFSSSDPMGTTRCGFLILSAGVRSRLFARDECEFLAISTSLDAQNTPQYHNVLWIGRKDGIVYRKGLGYIMADAWDNLNPKREDIVLG
ncbi:uncharacterized protein PG998_011744 [Apiospora kogelbergensis]|uniref:uncharacterized protein n=1 Tax=Apiospora kogelbergensis TaxID=1337665 RepID=UPI003132150F